MSGTIFWRHVWRRKADGSSWCKWLPHLVSCLMEAVKWRCVVCERVAVPWTKGGKHLWNKLKCWNEILCTLKYSNVESKKWYCVNGLQLCEEEIWQKNLQMKNEWISCEMNLMCCINWIHKHTLLKWPRKISLYSLAFLWRYFLHLCFNLQVWKNIKWRKSSIMNLIDLYLKGAAGSYIEGSFAEVG